MSIGEMILDIIMTLSPKAWDENGEPTRRGVIVFVLQMAILIGIVVTIVYFAVMAVTA